MPTAKSYFAKVSFLVQYICPNLSMWGIKTGLNMAGLTADVAQRLKYMFCYFGGWKTMWEKDKIKGFFFLFPKCY